MNPEQQRIAIAEWCGWKYKNTPTIAFGADSPLKGWYSPKGVRGSFVPDYLNDLNAMHEAENKLDNSTGRDFVETLCNVRGGWEHNTYFDLFVRSSATQRAEALLRTIGRWTDSTLHTKG